MSTHNNKIIWFLLLKKSNKNKTNTFGYRFSLFRFGLVKKKLIEFNENVLQLQKDTLIFFKESVKKNEK
jgi:hypothetical protein